MSRGRYTTGYHVPVPDDLKALAGEKGFYVSASTWMTITGLVMTERHGPHPRRFHEFISGGVSGPSVFEQAREMLGGSECGCLECARHEEPLEVPA